MSPAVSVIGTNRGVLVTAICVGDELGETVCRGVVQDVTANGSPQAGRILQVAAGDELAAYSLTDRHDTKGQVGYG